MCAGMGPPEVRAGQQGQSERTCIIFSGLSMSSMEHSSEGA